MRVGFIGSSSISKFHLEALQKNGFQIEAIGTRKYSQNCFDIAKDFDLIEKYCPGGWEEVLEKKLDAFCICIDINSVNLVLEKALNLNKPILIEKPVAYELNLMEKFKEHSNKNNIFVAFNRRYYQTVNEAKRLCQESNGGTIYVNVPDSVRGAKNFLRNGCHMVDTLIYILGDFEIKKTIRRYNSFDLDSISSICENKKWKILFNAHSLIPANFSITINTDKKVFELKPLEKLSIYNGLKISEPNEAKPIREYLPALKKSIHESSICKPGFDKMYKAFGLFIKGDLEKNLCKLEDAQLTLEKCWEFIGKDNKEII